MVIRSRRRDSMNVQLIYSLQERYKMRQGRLASLTTRAWIFAETEWGNDSVLTLQLPQALILFIYLNILRNIYYILSNFLIICNYYQSSRILINKDRSLSLIRAVTSAMHSPSVLLKVWRDIWRNALLKFEQMCVSSDLEQFNRSPQYIIIFTYECC
ncbi:hypothetical protein FGO68_gene5561 [Halteria grandinella]|uniref:Uncharacterized protein n=1 Tax=Halteria grandinella TaxID=5974 RepID=A0A8J8P2Q3_HALGN|nr:hypothetical protein FGO68_gene5561 [Halteria grandinella]